MWCFAKSKARNLCHEQRPRGIMCNSYYKLGKILQHMGFLHNSSFMLGQPWPNGCLSSNVGIMLFILKFKHSCYMSLCTKRCHIFPIVATRYYAQCQQDCKSIGVFIWRRWTFTNGSKTKLAETWNDSEDERKSMYIVCERNFYNEPWTLPIVGHKNAKN